ncbi:MAG: D-glycerate dehydrogenase [Alphaproteobacteria bacterium]|nr:D-glycerate dehydrogenase [Alphaproteobacteria bacterium]MBU0797854.1 D-glycerate dehydrogenase [Alphaproteobacteria bacterium]MBU0886699.1 D-glycerate dehydrogenase [Alphaproteobacteria bacterium]MBU1814554.1 D-glycerate dehydrogenase [Alphaproteobacteria bacterium]
MAQARPRILVTRKMPAQIEARIARDYDATTNPEDSVFDADRLVRDSAGHQGLLVCSTEKLPARVIEKLPDEIRIIATFSVGHDHIDLDAARARGITVTNTPDVLTDATADTTFLLLLAAARRAYEGERMVREDRWGRWAPTSMLGVHVTGKRLAILGMGRIGRAVAQRARGFEMEIHYNNRSRLSPELEQGAIFHEDPEELLGVADFLSINCPATAETHHFLNAARIARLPDGAVVVNTARGAIVHDESLIAALKSGKLAAAGLDVFENEPAIHPGYRDLSNCFLLPHIGSATNETRQAMGFRALDNLDAFFAARPPRDRVV